MAVNCDPDALIEAATQYRKITGSNVGAVVIYLLAQKAGLGNLTADQLINLARCYDSCIPPGMMKAVEIALLCSATGGVTPCPPQLPCPPSGGCTYQDMQVAWTPTNLLLGEKFQFAATKGADQLGGATSLTFSQSTAVIIDVEGESALLSVYLPNLTSVIALHGYVQFSQNTNLATINMPLFSTGSLTITDSAATSLSFPSWSNMDASGAVRSNPLLTSLDIPSLVFQNGDFADFSLNALPSSNVNAILAIAVASAAFLSGTLNLQNQTPAAPPTGQGIADKATLIGRGVTVNTD